MARTLQLSICSILLLCAARGAALPPLPHEAYIWQRQWTPALMQSMRESRSTFAGFRVLAAESDKRGRLRAIEPRLTDLPAREHVPIVAVIRLNGSDPPPDVAALRERVHTLAREWRAAGVALSGIEIDHDCATARLADYARLLQTLRDDWPDGVRLSITALPAWIGASALPDLLVQADESVLQVHAVRSPDAGLFDPAAARRWIDMYATISTKPFRVSLPAYGVRVQFDERGRARAVTAEMFRDADGGASEARELRARPRDVAELLRSLASAHPPQLVGVTWFRLPTEDDRRAWSLATLRAVIAAAELIENLQVSLQNAADGASDVMISNRGNLDAELAPVTVRADHCLAADGAGGYHAVPEAIGWRFDPPPDVVLRAGRARRVGWLRCGSVENADIVEKVVVDEAP